MHYLIQFLISKLQTEVEVPEYTYEEFSDIAIRRLAKEKVDINLATIIAEKVWTELGSRDIRDVIKVGRLADDSREVSYVIDIIKKHRCVRFSRVLLL